MRLPYFIIVLGVCFGFFSIGRAQEERGRLRVEVEHASGPTPAMQQDGNVKVREEKFFGADYPAKGVPLRIRVESAQTQASSDEQQAQVEKRDYAQEASVYEPGSFTGEFAAKYPAFFNPDGSVRSTEAETNTRSALAAMQRANAEERAQDDIHRLKPPDSGSRSQVEAYKAQREALVRKYLDAATEASESSTGKALFGGWDLPAVTVKGPE